MKSEKAKDELIEALREKLAIADRALDKYAEIGRWEYVGQDEFALHYFPCHEAGWYSAKKALIAIRGGKR
jgi:hypothetical protein